MNWKRVSALGLGLCVSVVLVGAGYAATSERGETMKHIGRALRPLVEMSKSGTFDQAEAQKGGNAIAGYLDHFKDLFPQGSEKEDDKALPTIWSDRAGFEQARTNAKNAALQVAAATDQTSFMTAFQALGGTCKACHDKYRSQQ